MNWFKTLKAGFGQGQPGTNPLGYPLYQIPQRAQQSLTQLLSSRELTVRSKATQLKDLVNDLIIVDRTVGGGPQKKALNEKIRQLQLDLNMDQTDWFVDASFHPDDSKQVAPIKQGNIKVLELDQFTAGAPELQDMTLQEFDTARLSGNDFNAAKELFGNHYQIKFVNENQSPSIGNVWYREDQYGKLYQWKANWDSSD